MMMMMMMMMMIINDDYGGENDDDRLVDTSNLMYLRSQGSSSGGSLTKERIFHSIQRSGTFLFH